MFKFFFFFFQAEDGIRDKLVTGVQTCALPISPGAVLIGCRLRLTRRPLTEVQKDIKVRLKQKKATQPLALASAGCVWKNPRADDARASGCVRSEEHTSELQSLAYLVCRLLLEKKKKQLNSTPNQD